MPDTLDAILANRAPVRGPQAEAMFTTPPEGQYDPGLDMQDPIWQGIPPVIAAQLKEIREMGTRNRQRNAASAVVPGLLSADPSSPGYTDTLNGLFAKHPDAISNPDVARILDFKQKLFKQSQPQMTAEDIADPELAQKWQERESSGLDWRKNKQQHIRDATAKQRRLELLSMGMDPEELGTSAERDGYINDEAFTRAKYRMSANQKAPLGREDLDKLIEAHEAASREPTPEDKLAWLQQRYPAVSQSALTPAQWEESYHALTSPKRALRMRVEALVNEGKLVPQSFLDAAGVQPTITRWDPKGRKIITGEQAPPPSTEMPVVSSPEEAMKLPSGTVFMTTDGKKFQIP